MILQSLNAYYRRLEEDPAADIAPFGFSRQKIAFCVTLEPDGTLHEIADLRIAEGNRFFPRLLLVLGTAKPSGSGIKKPAWPQIGVPTPIIKLHANFRGKLLFKPS